MSLLEHFERLVMPDTEAAGWFAGLRRVVARTVVDTFDDHVPGLAAEMAFFVRCDRSVITQDDLDNGRLICEVGIAIIKPAEFLVFKIGQKTADARS